MAQIFFTVTCAVADQGFARRETIAKGGGTNLIFWPIFFVLDAPYLGSATALRSSLNNSRHAIIG